MTKTEEDKYVRLERMTKSKLRDFNIEEARGWTIDRLQQIEYRINEKIIDHFKPNNKSDFERILLNSSIMDIGSKLKVLRNINVIDKLTIEKIRTLASIRNGFAHAPITEHVDVFINTDEATHGPSKVLVQTMIEVMNSQGEIKSKNAYKYLVEFLEINNELRKIL